MDTAIVVALISLVSSIGVAVWTAIWTARQQREAAESERRLSAAEELRRHREPLVDAANELGSRIDNIREEGFLTYLRPEYGRRDVAVQSTLYRFAKYFRTVEALYEGGNPLRFERAEETRAVADVLAAIGRTFASDDYDRTNGFESSRLMIWREEQRAFGDSVRNTAGDAVCVGFTEFVTRYDKGADKWFAKFASDLEHPDTSESERLAELQSHLAALVRLLDVDGRFARTDGGESGWLRRAEAPRTE
jgi:hypothetical protein